MKQFLITLTALLLLTQSALAATLTVGGSASVDAQADGASVTLGVRAYGQDVRETQAGVNERINAISEALKTLGVPKESIVTDTVYIYPYTNEEDEISGYSISSSLTVVTNDLDQMGAVIDTAIEAGANTMDLGGYTSSKSEEAFREALALAVKDAMEKAEVIAEASGLQITGIATIDETGYSTSGAPMKRAYGLLTEEAVSDAATEVRAATLQVSANVTVVFNAEPLED